MQWKVEFHKDFDPEFDALPDHVRHELLAHTLLPERFGPQLGRPRVDTLNGSRHPDMGDKSEAEKKDFIATSLPRPTDDSMTTLHE